MEKRSVLAKLVKRFPDLSVSLYRIAIKGPTQKDGYGCVYAFHEPGNYKEFKIGRTAHSPFKRIAELMRKNGRQYIFQKQWNCKWHKLLEKCVHLELEYCNFYG